MLSLLVFMQSLHMDTSQMSLRGPSTSFNGKKKETIVVFLHIIIVYSLVNMFMKFGKVCSIGFPVAELFVFPPAPSPPVDNFFILHLTKNIVEHKRCRIGY